MFETIVAIASVNVNQPISIIRISGSEAFKITNQIFTGKIGVNNKISHGYIKDKKEIIDEVLVASFVGPKSFTGEDIIEINAHGGIVNMQKILKLILSKGIRMAQPGEFSRRAFLNNKMDLVKAEAIHDLIFAKTEEQAHISVKKFDGQTSKLIKKITNKILNIITIIETNIDYPEYDDIEKITNKTIIPKLNLILKELQEIKNFSKSSYYIYEGVKVGIVGRPNSGKSSLLNAILGESKAIVTNVPGTTRDIVEGQIQIGQILFKFSDTAGIRLPTSKIEAIGINRSLAQIEKSDLVLHIIDATKSENEDDKKIQKKAISKPYIKIFNKSDLIKVNKKIAISAIKNNIEPVFNALKSKFRKIDLNDQRMITNTRQLALIDESIDDIEKAIKGIQNGLEPDEVILDIRNSWKNLGNIIGEVNDEDMLDMMFSNFCLGK